MTETFNKSDLISAEELIEEIRLFCENSGGNHKLYAMIKRTYEQTGTINCLPAIRGSLGIVPVQMFKRIR